MFAKTAAITHNFARKPWAGVLLLLLAAGCAPSAPPAGESPAPDGRVPVTLLLNWFPEVEHGGYYAALINGYFADEGLDVSILPGGAKTPVVEEVARGRFDFGIANADNILFARAQQAPVVAVMAPLQTSPRCLLVHASSGIKRFEDLRDLTIAVTPGAFVEWMRKKLPLDGVQWVNYGGSVQQFLLNADYAQQGYVFSEPFVAREKGGDPEVLMLADLGFNPYSSLLITSEERIRTHGEVVRKMVAASIRGWQAYLHDPAVTNRRIHELNREMELPALTFGAEALAPLVRPDKATDIGSMTLERWQTLADQLVESGQLPAGQVDPGQAFTDRFLPPAPAR